MNTLHKGDNVIIIIIIIIIIGIWCKYFEIQAVYQTNKTAASDTARGKFKLAPLLLQVVRFVRENSRSCYCCCYISGFETKFISIALGICYAIRNTLGEKFSTRYKSTQAIPVTLEDTKK
jgi:hypothetical protein